jgi:hypothetical protein
MELGFTVPSMLAVHRRSVSLNRICNEVNSQNGSRQQGLDDKFLMKSDVVQFSKI